MCETWPAVLLVVKLVHNQVECFFGPTTVISLGMNKFTAMLQTLKRDSPRPGGEFIHTVATVGGNEGREF